MKKRQVFRDLHPNWDRFRGTLLYPLSCGELAMNGEWILRINITTGAPTARSKCTKIVWKTQFFDQKKTLLQKLSCLIYNIQFSSILMQVLD